jgi:hypothetical protein
MSVCLAVRVNEMVSILFWKRQKPSTMRKTGEKRRWKVCTKYEWRDGGRLQSGKNGDSDEGRRVIAETL